tara:strand:- start:154 stop:486 length:333 start_codon:yes stop_codon:yes gene_type:complete
MEIINKIYEIIIADPVYITISIVLTVIILFGIIKKLFKIFFIAFAILVLYLFYLNYTGKEIPKDLNELSNSLKENVENVSKDAKELLKDEKLKDIGSDIIENTKEILKSK